MEDAGEKALGDLMGDRVDVRGQGAIFGDFWGDRADRVVGRARQGAGVERGEEIDTLARTEQFDGESVAEIQEHALKAAGAAHAHADVVFLIA